uniref:Uncharacterized protein n=1 Tax=Plectus sambesii TaxID=2011161 RepID=A0A914VRV9_9BILA
MATDRRRQVAAAAQPEAPNDPALAQHPSSFVKDWSDRSSRDARCDRADMVLCKSRHPAFLQCLAPSPPRSGPDITSKNENAHMRSLSKTTAR